ncbi:hypothetical protein F511_35870 [Dorcoceras hygrometricum]|uniref:GDT1 family protein n=1 Tax=Dorcoceras hygrometricum TaxID=472368 RepID=A0A2Z7BLW6_9LAMI|nr:hypothetical protein F511_35870 [Dorcoceras hygrometricum]
MQVLALLQTPQVLVSSKKSSKQKAPVFYDLIGSPPFSPLTPRRSFTPFQCWEFLESVCKGRAIRTHALNVGTGSGGYEERHENEKHNLPADSRHLDSSTKSETSHHQFPLPLSIALVLCTCALVYSLIALMGGPASLLTALAMSGFTAAFSLIFVSEIADKTFFIAALLAMQHEQIMVLLGSMGALTIKTIVSIAIGRIFQSVPAQFRTTLPIGEYAAVTLLLFFGLQSIRDAWKLPPTVAKMDHRGSQRSKEPAEEMSVKLSPIEVLGESFSLVFFSEWGDRSMLATMALGAAQSPLGVASGAIAGHLLATFIAVLGGSFLSHYISEKLSGYICGSLFLVFAIATFFGVF